MRAFLFHGCLHSRPALSFGLAPDFVVSDALGHDRSKFSEQSADLIGLHGTRLYKTMDRMHR